MITRRVPLRRGAPPRRMSRLKRRLTPERKVPVKKKWSQPPRGPQRCPDYLAWIRTLGCAIHSCTSRGPLVVEAAHTNALGPRGLSQKTSDFSAIPLCSAHYRQRWDSYHRLVEEGFIREHRTDLSGLVLGLKSRFGRQTGGECVVRHLDRSKGRSDSRSPRCSECHFVRPNLFRPSWSKRPGRSVLVIQMMATPRRCGTLSME